MRLEFLPIVLAVLIAPVAAAADPEADKSAVTAVLAAYQRAVERLDPSGSELLFAAGAQIFESGSSEGDFTTYLARHLTPELGEFKSFKFSDYKVEIRFVGPVALATETYRYRIVPKIGDPAERIGVATSVLQRFAGRWQIISMHSSAHKLRN